MERKDISAANFDWNALLHHVVEDRASVEVVRKNIPLARITPVVQPVLLSDFSAVLGRLPSLGDDVDAFADDIEQALRQLPAADDPGAS